ncbi:MAG: restriction endonuclease subunit S [Bacilli bacterium]
MIKNIPKRRFKGFNDEWEDKKLGEIGTVLTGNTPSTINKENWSDDSVGYVWITPSDINKLKINNSERKLTETGWKKSRQIPINSVLITSIASIGKNAINTVSASINQQINAIIPKNNDYYFILNSMEKEVKRFSSEASLVSNINC